MQLETRALREGMDRIEKQLDSIHQKLDRLLEQPTTRLFVNLAMDSLAKAYLQKRVAVEYLLEVLIVYIIARSDYTVDTSDVRLFVSGYY